MLSDPTLKELDVFDSLSVVRVADVNVLIVPALSDTGVAVLDTGPIPRLQVSGVRPGGPTILRERYSERDTRSSGGIIDQDHMAIRQNMGLCVCVGVGVWVLCIHSQIMEKE